MAMPRAVVSEVRSDYLMGVTVVVVHKKWPGEHVFKSNRRG
jgi:hypothetical protein